MARIETYVFIDLETTGLPRSEFNKTRITELSMLAVKRDHLLESSGVPPRVQHKLTLCLNPRRPVSEASTQITGLCNFLLEYEPEFNKRVFSLLDTFLSVLTQPVCLIAYNGFNFDYPILQNHLAKLQVQFTADVLCADMLDACYNIENRESLAESNNTNLTICNKSDEKVQEITISSDQDTSTTKPLNQLSNIETKTKDENDFYTSNLSMQAVNETTPKSLKRNSSENLPGKVKRAKRQLFPWKDSEKQSKSYKLTDVYERVVKKPANDAHRAECDCVFCLEIFAFLAKQFVEWVDNNHYRFADIDPMTLGVPI